MSQILLVLMAFVLLGSTIIGVNVMVIDKTTTMLEAEASLTSVSVGQSMMDEIMTKNFDAATASGTRIYDSSLFTAPNALGPSGAEASHVPLPDGMNASERWYNDVDDYNGYIRTTATPILGTFTVKDSIFYVSQSNPNVKVNHQTNLKKVVVIVTHRNMSYRVILEDLIVYRKFF